MQCSILLDTCTKCVPQRSPQFLAKVCDILKLFRLFFISIFSYCTILVPLWLGIIVFLCAQRSSCVLLLLPPTSMSFLFLHHLSVYLSASANPSLLRVFFFFFLSALALSFIFVASLRCQRRSFFTVLLPSKAPSGFRFNDDVVGKVKGRLCSFVISFCPGHLLFL